MGEPRAVGRFPSPCGELRVSDEPSPRLHGLYLLGFPSPCGELRVSDDGNQYWPSAAPEVSVPLRGIEGV